MSKGSCILFDQHVYLTNYTIKKKTQFILIYIYNYDNDGNSLRKCEFLALVSFVPHSLPCHTSSKRTIKKKKKIKRNEI